MEDVKYGNDSKSRALNFLNFIKEKYKGHDQNILFATHAGLIDDITEDGQPPMGSLTLHCENDKILNLPLNYKILKQQSFIQKLFQHLNSNFNFYVISITTLSYFYFHFNF